MRGALAVLAFVVALLVLVAHAEIDNAAPLFGSWRLVSFQLKLIGEDGPPQEVFGSHPFGRIVFAPDHHMSVFISKPDRKPPADQAEAAALLSSMTAYTGRFRLEGDKFITSVDGAWNEYYRGTEQVRFFVLDGDKLSIRTAEQASAIVPGKRTIVTLTWVRER
jgi:hypothetical protein